MKGRTAYNKAQRNLGGGDKIFYILIMVIVTWVFAFAKTPLKMSILILDPLICMTYHLKNKTLLFKLFVFKYQRTFWNPNDWYNNPVGCHITHDYIQHGVTIKHETWYPIIPISTGLQECVFIFPGTYITTSAAF